MQGRQGRGKEPWDRPSRDRNDALNGSGKQRVPPQRPRGMARLDTPPSVQRVARPKREQKPPKSRRRRFLTALLMLVVGAVLVFIVVFGVVNFFNAVGNSAGPANTAADFLVNLKSQTYAQAYQDLDAIITGTLHPDAFLAMAQADDRCYGTIADFNEVEGSAVISNNSQTFTYSVTRNKLAKPYQLTLTLQKNPNDPNGNWDITRFVVGNGTPNTDLGPGPGLPTC